MPKDNQLSPGPNSYFVDELTYSPNSKSAGTNAAVAGGKKTAFGVKLTRAQDPVYTFGHSPCQKQSGNTPEKSTTQQNFNSNKGSRAIMN